MSNSSETAVIESVGPESAGLVLGLVAALLRELGEEGDEAGTLDEAALTDAWREEQPRQFAFLARGRDGAAVGVVTVTEAFAFYAGGRHGIINEMYVAPSHRSSGVGGQLIRAVASLGRAKGWRRIDVTAPESARWARTRRFYEQQGFVFAGPKLKYLL